MKPPTIGQLRDLVRIEKPTISRDSRGQSVTTWAEVATVRAFVRPVSAREAFVAGASQVTRYSEEIWLRCSSSISVINASCRLVLITRGNRTANIDGIRHEGVAGHWICATTVGEGGNG